MARLLSKLLLASGLALAFAGVASAQQVTKLKYATFLPSSHPIAAQHGLYLVELGKKELQGKVEFEIYVSEQAGKAGQLFDLVKSGAVDIVDLATGYYSSDKMPLMGIWEVPGLQGNSCAITRVTQQLAAPGQILWESEFKPTGIHVLSFALNPAYGPAIARIPVNSVEAPSGV